MTEAQRGDPMAIADLMDTLAQYVARVCGPIALQDGPTPRKRH